MGVHLYNLILEYKTPSYEWSYNGLMNKLIMYVDEDDITVLMHNDNKLALSVTNEDISKFFGNDYIVDPISCAQADYMWYEDVKNRIIVK